MGHFLTTAIAVALSVLISARAAVAAELNIQRWQPYDFAFQTAVEPANPFEVVFSAEVMGPDGVMLAVPGFYDGDRTWKVRVSPMTEGAWSIVTRCETAELNSLHRSFRCVASTAPQIHGALRIDPDQPRQFVLEDGTRYLPMGYECDWLWALDANEPELKKVNQFLDVLAGHGFNFIILNAYAHDTSWREGQTGQEDFGPPPMYPWEGTNKNPDHGRFNLAYWRHYDRVIEAMHRRGIMAHILIKVYNKKVNWPTNSSPEEDLYFRWLIARYAAYPNVHWDLAKEAQYEKDLDYKTERLRFIRAHDPYRRLLTVHDDRVAYDSGAYDALVDYRSDQQHEKWRDVMLAHREQRAWPVINTEFGYEHGPGGLSDKTYNVVQTPEEVCRRAWQVYTAGGFGAYYYTYTAWDVLRTQEIPPGYAYFKRVREFFEGTNYWRMKPVQGVASAGDCLADLGREYVVYVEQTQPVTMKLEGLESPLSVQWYRPLTGQRETAGVVSNGLTELKPPPSWDEGPAALHLVARHE